MKVEVLVSCTRQRDYKLIEDENLLNTTALFVNQTESGEGTILVDEKHRFINTSTRGLSVSRNIAKNNSVGDICVIGDDDERFFDNISEIVSKEYELRPDADIIVFKVAGLNKKYPKKAKRLKKIDVFHLSSVQITFKRKSVENISFNEKMGAGTENGGGEEVDFVLRCLKKGLKAYFVPVEMAELMPSESSWFNGYDEKYFYNRGTSTRHTFGLPISVAYAFYYVIAKRKSYKGGISVFHALNATLKGIRDNKLKDKK